MSEPLVHLGPVADEGPSRERFEAHELAIVLSHYDIGTIEQIREFPFGSRRSPKVRIVASAGEFLLKRRAPGRQDPFRVAFAHELMLHMKRSGVPVPGLLGTRTDRNSLLQIENRTYELFEYMPGRRPTPDARTAIVSGMALGQFHAAAASFESQYEAPEGTYHTTDLSSAFEQLPEAVQQVQPDVDISTLRAMTQELAGTFNRAAEQVAALGYDDWPVTVVHGDWHPGNLLMQDERITAVLDFDSARFAPRMVDVSNAALQFSMRTGSVDKPENWPEGVSHRRIRGMLRGYEQQGGQPLTDAERQAVPWLIIEAMIVESVLPIAATGRFAHVAGDRFLTMVDQKVRWLQPRAAKLVSYLNEVESEGARDG